MGYRLNFIFDELNYQLCSKNFMKSSGLVRLSITTNGSSIVSSEVKFQQSGPCLISLWYLPNDTDDTQRHHRQFATSFEG